MKKYPVFVVEDDEEDFDFLRDAFLEADCTNDIQHYHNADQLLDALSRRSADQYPALIVLDHHTPGRNGSDTVNYIRANKNLNRIVVVVYSSSLPAPLQEKLMQQGVDLCLTKGNSAEDMLTHVQMFSELVEKNQRSTRL